MSDMQEVTQQESSVAPDTGNSPAMEASQQNVGSNQATGSGQVPGTQTTDPASQKFVDAERFNKLTSNYQRTIAREREIRTQYEKAQQEAHLYRQQKAELEQRLAQTEQQYSRSQQSPNGAQPNFEGMNTQEILDFFGKDAEERAMRVYERQDQMRQQQQQQRQQEEVRQRDVATFQNRWDEVLSQNPDIDENHVEEMKEWMANENVFNPKIAHEMLYGSKQKAEQMVEKARVETVEKVSKNARDFTEGAGKAGIVPPAPRGSLSSKEKAEAIKKQYFAAKAKQPKY